MKSLLRAVLLRFIPVILSILLLAACGSDGGSVSQVAPGDGECFSNEGKAEVLNIMEDWYLWNDEADQFNKYRNLDLDNFDDAADLLSFLRYLPGQFDRGFSYITTPEEEEAFFGEGEFIGFGFSMALVGDDIYFTQVYEGSPAAAAGFWRGFRLVAINGRSVDQIMASEGISAALGPEQIGFSVTFSVEDLGNNSLPPVSLSKAVVTIDPVPVVAALGSGDDTGYILFNTFISSANSQLRDAFAFFATEGMDKVVVDLRYNGGGLVSVSEVLASLLAGPGHVGDPFVAYEFNSDRAPAFNDTSSFQAEPNAHVFDKIVFITSDGSASASELVINGLRPYFTNPGTFALVGASTYGKPVGQFAFDFCDADYRLRAVTFQSVNANGVGGYFYGLPVDCPAEDDLSHSLAAPSEASLAAALEYLETGSCPISFGPGAGVSSVRRGAAKARPVFGPTLAQQYAGAF